MHVSLFSTPSLLHIFQKNVNETVIKIKAANTNNQITVRVYVTAINYKKNNKYISR